jgi:hypothetical protein
MSNVLAATKWLLRTTLSLNDDQVPPINDISNADATPKTNFFELSTHPPNQPLRNI